MNVEAVVFDFDGTLTVHRAGWLLLHELFGTREAGDERTTAYRAGDIDFAEWCRGNVADWQARGVTAADVERAAQAVKLTRGASDLFGWLHAEGLPFGVVSGGVTDLQQRLDPFDPAFRVGNDLRFADGKLVGVTANVGPDDKDEVLGRVCAERGISLEGVVYVGDSHTDVEAFEVAGHAILFDPDDRLPDRAYDLVDDVVETRDMAHVRDAVAGVGSDGGER